MAKAETVFDKEIGGIFNNIFDLIYCAHEELSEREIVVKRSDMSEFAHFVGLYIYPATADFKFFIGFFPTYYEITGIPLCFGIESENSNDKLHPLLKKIIAEEPSLYEYREIETIPICGIKPDKIDELNKDSSLANYFLSLVEKSGYSIKVK